MEWLRVTRRGSVKILEWKYNSLYILDLKIFYRSPLGFWNSEIFGQNVVVFLTLSVASIGAFFVGGFMADQFLKADEYKRAVEAWTEANRKAVAMPSYLKAEVGSYDFHMANCSLVRDRCEAVTRNSCASAKDEREKLLILEFRLADCGGFDGEHKILLVYSDHTCLFVESSQESCPGG
ncbi:MAG: hypothetical protein HYY51_04320 [Candidatus Magasanikbacteria bacterium]|nr:hypothetical protein [Candidatus Magasanikbacteria bacterium]